MREGRPVTGEEEKDEMEKRVEEMDNRFQCEEQEGELEGGKARACATSHFSRST